VADSNDDIFGSIINLLADEPQDSRTKRLTKKIWKLVWRLADENADEIQEFFESMDADASMIKLGLARAPIEGTGLEYADADGNFSDLDALDP
jgi:hypothetical protein